MTRPDLSLMHEFEAALAWWQDAGVSDDFRDDATAWLTEAAQDQDAPAVPQAAGTAHVAPTARAPAPAMLDPAAGLAGAPATVSARAPRRDLLGDSPPVDLAALRDWWMTAPGLDTARGYPRIAPRGPAGAALMVLVPQPEAGDRESLLEGPQGRLLSAIRAATGIAEDALYIAAALPCHTPMADHGALAREGFDAVTLHHVALAAPQRLLVLGTTLAPMLGKPAGNGLEAIETRAGTIPVMISETLEAMMDMPRLKARFWRRWMEWSVTR